METDAGEFRSSSPNMDDLDYSVHIAEHDWSSFFQECEECDILQASLASLDDSGLSDTDDGEKSLLNMAAPTGKCCLSTEKPRAPQSISSYEKEGEYLGSESSPNKDPANRSFCEEAPQGPWNMSEETAAKKPSYASNQDGFDSGPVMLIWIQSKHQEGHNEVGILKEVAEPNDATCLVGGGRICQGTCTEIASGELRCTTFCSKVTEKTSEAFNLAEEWHVTEDRLLENGGDFHKRSVVGAVTATSSQQPSNTSMKPLNSGLWVIPDEPQTHLQMQPKAEPERKEKERWFVTMDISQTHSRENVGTLGKKKKRKKRFSRCSPELGLGYGGWDPAIQSESEGERSRVAGPQRQELSRKLELFQSRGETAACVDKARHHFLSPWPIQNLSKPSLLSHDPNFGETTKSMESQSHRTSEDYCHSEKELESRQKLQICSECRSPGEKPSHYENSFWPQELMHSTADSNSICYEFRLQESCNRGLVEGEISIVDQSGRKESNSVNSTIPSCDQILDYALSKQDRILSDSTWQGKGSPPEQFLSHTTQTSFTVGTNSKYQDANSPAQYFEPQVETLESPQGGGTLLAQKQTHNVLNSSWKLVPPEDRHVFPVDPETLHTPGHSFTLSASDFTQPPIALNKNVCTLVRDYLDSLLPQGQQSTTEQPSPITLSPDTCAPKYSGEIPTETGHNLLCIFRDYTGINSRRKEEDHRGDEQVMKTEELTNAGFTQNFEIQNLEAMPSPSIDPKDKQPQEFTVKGEAADETSPVVGRNSTVGTAECYVSREPLSLNAKHPFYAISPFWDEMEKLTINDILHLRLVSHAHTPGDLHYNVIADPSDAADSDYFTLLDDSKPDRFSGEFSTLSNFEEELFQVINTSTNPSPEPQDKKHDECSSARLPSSTLTLWETDLEPQEGFPQFCSEYTCQCHLLQSCTIEQGPLHPIQADRQNSCLYFLSHQDSGKRIRSEPTEHLESVGKTCPPFTDGDVLADSFNIPLSKELECSLEEDDTTAGLLDTSTVVCFPDGNAPKLSVPEMYDHFFAEFDTGSLFFPQTKGCNVNRTITIFSCSRSDGQSLQFSHDCLIVENSSVHSNDEDDHKPIRVVTHSNKRVGEPRGAVALPDTYEEFCTDSDWKGNLFWRHPFSLRGTRFLRGSLHQLRGSSISWDYPSLSRWGNSLFCRIASASQGDRNYPCIDYMEKQMFIQKKEGQQANPIMQTALYIPGRDSLLLCLQQADLCLVCIAFASWLLKTVKPQDADTWKTILLANVSAVSAIRYLRHSTFDCTPDHVL